MKKLYILTLVYILFTIKGYSQNLFNQDFTSSSTLTDYFKDPSPAQNQLNFISSYGTIATKIASNTVVFGKTTSSIIINRKTPITTNPLTFLKFQFKLKMDYRDNSVVTTGNPTFFLGNGTSTGWSNLSSTLAPDDAELFAKFDIVVATDDVAQAVQYRLGGSSVLNASNSYGIVTVFCNTGVAAVDYTGMDGNTYTLASKKFDIWLNNGRVRATVNATTSTVAPTMFKMVYPSQMQSVDISIDYIKIWDQTTVLPISLSRFNGQLANNGIKLDWKTASEQNNSHFEVLRSQDGKEFTAIATISGNGNSNAPIAYQYVDNNPLKGTNYYKLKQYDLNGNAEEFAKVVAVQSGLGTANQFTAFYNDGLINLNYLSSSAQKSMLVTVHDINGKSILSKNIAISSINSNYALPIQLTNGIYVVSVIDGKDSFATKIIN
ncbi:T9SS type A sorting domain-containing protein [Pedobacter arcticus]|uniref:T9SS type A sorting domain-containing protein n=1 Tax=Pedobacter arcticus TaxID=752140 RepID=UPI0002D77FC6|nr:T9SS type A sorting domain-containing protein [Pedobacter arcticus]